MLYRRRSADSISQARLGLCTEYALRTARLPEDQEPVSRFAGKWTTAGFLKLVRPVLSWDLNDAFFEA
jgi:hypothetical protein